MLWALMGHRVSETAAELGVSQSAVRSVIARAMSKLRKMPQMRELMMDWLEED